MVLERIEKRYASTPILLGIDLEVAAGEFVALLGPSGSGKTTTLRIIAGLVEATSGRVVIRGEDVTAVPTHRRHLAMVFQQYALFPHMTVEDNVWFGLRMRGVSRRAAADRITHTLELVRMLDFRHRYPSQLSGGQQQRVGLARCLVVDPAVLLLDEPFGALDRQLRDGMQRELRELQQRLGITTMFVTHDQDEALAISDRVVVMNGGRIEQVGSPKTVYRHPASLFVASFVGTANMWKGRCVEVAGHRSVVDVLGHKVSVPRTATMPGDEVVVVVRPEDVVPSGNNVGVLTISGTVRQDVYRGSSRSIVVDLDTGEDAVCVVADDLDVSPGVRIRFAVPADRLQVFPARVP